MEKILIPIFIIITLLILYTIYINLKPHFRKQKLFRLFKEKLDNQNSEIQFSTSKSYDFNLTVQGEMYLIKFIFIERNAEITINNPITWELHYGGGEYIGKPYRHHRFLTEVIPFLKLKSDAKKVVICYHDVKRVLKWVNESEMILIKPNQAIDGVMIMNIEDFFHLTLHS